MDQLHDHVKHLIDWAAVATAVAAFAAWLPPIAALLSAIWTLLRMVEMFTGKTIAELRGKK